MSTWFGLGVLGGVAVALSASSCATERVPEGSAPRRTSAPAAPGTFIHTDAGYVTGRGIWRARIGDDGVIALAGAGDGRGSLELETVSLGRGISAPARCLDVALAQGEVRIDRGWVTESVSYEPMGVAQRWHFSRAPAGDGDLEVVIEASGPTGVEDAMGLTFVDHGVRFAYGGATWVDADGTRTPLGRSFADGAIVLTVPEAVLDASSYPAVLDPTVTVSTDLDTAPTYLPAPEAQHDVQVASDGTDAFALWTDDRHETPEIFGTGVLADGTPYLPANVRLVPGVGALSPLVAHLSTEMDGTRKYVAVWTTLFDLEATPFDMEPTGDVIIGDSVSLHTPPFGTYDSPSSIAASDVDYLVTFVDSAPAGDELHTMLVDSASHTAIAGPISLTAVTSAGGGTHSASTWVSTRYIIANRANATASLRARVIRPSLFGQEANIEIVPAASAASDADIATDGTNAMAVWLDHRVGGVEPIWGRRMSESAMIGSDFEIIGAPNLPDRPRVSRTPVAGEYVLSWRDFSVLEGELVATVVHSNDTITTTRSGLQARFQESAGIGADTVIVYDDRTTSDPIPETTDTWAIAFDGAAFGTPHRLSNEANRQIALSVDADAGGGAALAVWADTRAGIADPDIFGTMVDSNGAPTGSLIAFPTSPLDEGDPSVAEGNGEWLVLWRRGIDTPGLGTDTQIIASLVAADGTILDTEQLADDTVNRYPRVVHDGNVYWATWEVGDFNCESFCQFFPANGHAVEISTAGGQITVTAQPTLAEAALGPAIAADPAGGALLVWEKRGDINAARVQNSTIGAVIPITAASGRQSRPAAAIRDDTALIVWQDDRGGGQQIYGARLLPDDAALSVDDIAGSIAAVEPEVVDAADGYSFLVVFEGSAFAAPEQIWGAWIKADGTIADPVPRQLTFNDTGAARRPGITGLGAGRILLGFDGVGPERSERARTAVADSGLTDGSTCDENDDCASRFCADLVCCNTACNGDCERCGVDGSCDMVTEGTDDSCFEHEACNEQGQCLSANGETCSLPSDCASGNCVDEICCESACDGQCDQCDAPGTPGQCRQQACAPYGCHPDKTCRETCEESRHCVDDFQCVDGKCQSAVDPVAVDLGCGCRMASRRTSHAALVALLGAALVLARRRRGRPRKPGA